MSINSVRDWSWTHSPRDYIAWHIDVVWLHDHSMIGSWLGYDLSVIGPWKAHAQSIMNDP